MDVAEAALADDKNLQANLLEWDKLTENGLKEWKSYLNNPGFGKFPSGFLNDYKAEGEELVKTSRGFNAEWNKVVFRKGDRKKLNSAFSAYSGSLQLLLASNARYKALVDLNLAVTCAGFVAIADGFARFALESKLNAELGQLGTEVQKAHDLVMENELKRGLNVLVAAISWLVNPQAKLAKAAKIAGGVTSQLFIDHALGEPSAKSTVNTFVSASAEAVPALGEAGKKFIAAASAVLSFKWDSDDLKKAKADLEKMQKKLKKTLDEYHDYYSGVLRFQPQLKKLEADLNKGRQSVQAALAKSSSAASKYETIRTSVSKAIK